MSVEREAVAREIFLDALECEPGARRAFVERACGTDAELRERVGRLLVAAGNLSGFLERDTSAASHFANALAVFAREPGGPPPDLAGALVGDRYRIDGVIGQGGFSHVYAAVDERTERRVALKLLTESASPAWGDHEIAALLAVDVPGVVRLLDEGWLQGRRYLVMELADGTSFPGGDGPVGHRRLLGLAAQVLEIVGRLHWNGIVHGDLKPSNVLVDARGHVTVLDLGIAAGPGVDGGTDQPRAGTPAYLPPEQLADPSSAASERGDLYAIGVMVYEALVGHVPHADEASGFAEARRTTPVDFSPLDARRVPIATRRLLARLLAVDVEARPANAPEALAALRGEAPPLEALARRDLPWIAEAADEVVARARGGGSVDLAGGSGSGRTRVLERALGVLGAYGTRVWRIGAAWEDGASLRAAFPPPPEIAAEGPDAVLDDCERQLRDALRRGDLIVSDDFENVDPWSAGILERHRGAGVVLRVLAEPTADAVFLRPVLPIEMRPLFAGPDRLLHLREDAARLLAARTGGVTARIVEELSTWVRLGLARHDERLVQVDRDALQRIELLPEHLQVESVDARFSAPDVRSADVLRCLTLAGGSATPHAVAVVLGIDDDDARRDLERLAAMGAVARRDGGAYALAVVPPTLRDWTRERVAAAHRALAGTHPEASARRVRHLIDAGAIDEIPAAAAAAARHQFDAGHASRGGWIVRTGLAAMRSLAPGHPGEAEMLRVVVELAFAEGGIRAFELALHEMARAGEARAHVQTLRTIARAALLGLRGDGLRAVAHMEALGRCDDPRDELHRWSVLAHTSRIGGRAMAQDVLDAALAWAEGWGTREGRRISADLRAWHAYRTGDFDLASEMHRRCVDLAGTDVVVAESRANLASALLEAARLEESEAEAALLLRDAARMRHALFEGRAERVLRSARYRADRLSQTDPELVAAVDSLASPALACLVVLNEAAVAWRAGDTRQARELAARAAAISTQYGHALAAGLARALCAAAGGEIDDATCARDIEVAGATALPRVGLQILGLHSQRDPQSIAGTEGAVIRLLDAVPPADRDPRREVLSVTEAMERLRA